MLRLASAFCVSLATGCPPKVRDSTELVRLSCGTPVLEVGIGMVGLGTLGTQGTLGIKGMVASESRACIQGTALLRTVA